MQKKIITGACVLLNAMLLLSAPAIEPIITGFETEDMKVTEISKTLWDHMWEHKLITDEQLEYVYAHNRLPGGTVVEGSPLEADRQKAWGKLAEHNVVTGEELAQMLLGGSVTNMEPWEIKAFEELAPVYEPDKRKRIAYDVKNKHAKVDLIRLAHRQKQEYAPKKAEAMRVAEEQGLSTEGLFSIENGRLLYWSFDNHYAADRINTVDVNTYSQFKLKGDGITLAQWDEGNVSTSHVGYATNRVVNMDNTTYVYRHAAGVAGTMVCREGVGPHSGAIGRPAGMAPHASLMTWDADGVYTTMTSAIAAHDIRLSNHSYGLGGGWEFDGLDDRWWGDTTISGSEDLQFGRYQEDAREFDTIAYNAPYHLAVRAASNDRDDDLMYGPYYYVRTNGTNGPWVLTSVYRPPDGGDDGYDCLTSPATAKNELVVGSVYAISAPGYPFGSRSSEFSSWGPTDDGRIKPDLCAFGEYLMTTDWPVTNYYLASGTSSAAPCVTGSLGLLLEYHRRIYGTNAPMLASTLKLLPIHTTYEIGDPVAPGPDYSFGWGVMDTKAAAYVITNNAAWDSLPHIKEVALEDGSYIEWDVLAVTSKPLKVSVAWTDPPGAIQPYALDPTNLVLVNDLDLRVIGPDGNTNFPWVLDPQNPTNSATTGDNFRDNVEQVLIAQPSNDWYTVRITHKGSLSNDVQDVSIVVTGNTPSNAPDFAITEAGAMGTNGLTTLEWPGVVGALYSVEASTNLLVSNGWASVESGMSANIETIQWSDADSTNHNVRFYRIKRLR